MMREEGGQKKIYLGRKKIVVIRLIKDYATGSHPMRQPPPTYILPI